MALGKNMKLNKDKLIASPEKGKGPESASPDFRVDQPNNPELLQESGREAVLTSETSVIPKNGRDCWDMKSRMGSY